MSITQRSKHQKAPVSLRLLNHFVVTYAQEDNCKYYTSDPYAPSGKFLFVVSTQYKEQLKCHSKRRFDPFCRCEGNYIHFRGVKTTLKQLNFFRWAFMCGVYDYVLQHLPEIEAHMRSRNLGEAQPQYVQKPQQPMSLMDTDQTVIRFLSLNT